MLPDLNEISSRQAKTTLYTKLATAMLINYAHTYPNKKIHYHARNTILNFELDSAYLSQLHCWEFYLSDHPTNPTKTGPQSSNPSSLYDD